MNNTKYLAPIENFVLGRDKNIWLKCLTFSIYVRKATHAIFGDIVDTFDIANIICDDEQLRGNGNFRKLLVDLEYMLQQYDFDAIYIENVLNKKLATSLPSMGFTEMKNYGFPELPSCFVKYIDRG